MVLHTHMVLQTHMVLHTHMWNKNSQKILEKSFSFLWLAAAEGHQVQGPLRALHTQGRVCTWFCKRTWFCTRTRGNQISAVSLFLWLAATEGHQVQGLNIMNRRALNYNAQTPRTAHEPACTPAHSWLQWQLITAAVTTMHTHTHTHTLA